jgi:hypothetical protein
MGLFSDLLGTLSSAFQIEKAGVKLKNNSANLEVVAADGTTPAATTMSKLNVTGDSIDINSDAAGSGSDWKYTITRPSSGMGAAVTLTLPVDDGTASQVLQTDGNGVLSWASAGTTADLVHVNSTTIAYGDSSPVSLFTLPANAVVHNVEIIIDTPFNAGSPTMSVGVSGTASKYMATSDINLKGTAKDRYMVHPGETPSGGTEDLIATFAKDTSTAGSVRVLVNYSNPA